MKGTLKILTASALVALALASTGVSSAAPSDPAAGVSPSVLVTPAARSALQAKVDLARMATPALFDTLRAIRADVPNLERQRRGNHALVGRILANLGKDALLPMLDMLVFREAEERALEPNARVAWRAGLIEAIGKLRDPFALPYIGALLDGPETEPHLVFAAAQALARHGGDESTDKLVLRSAQPDPKRVSIVKALGECRREKAARAIVAVLESNTADPLLSKTAVDALGMVGSSWAWAVPEVAKNGEGDRTREVAARALIAALPKLAVDAQRDVAVALSSIELAQTGAWMQEARLRGRVEDRAVFDRTIQQLRK